MSRPRLTIDNMEPAFVTLRVDLQLNTCVDQRAFEAWANHNKYALLCGFGREGLPAIFFRGWAMEQFINRAQVSA